MAIDRIGKGGSSIPPKPASGTERAQGSDAAKTFEVRPSHTEAAQTQGAHAQGASTGTPVAPTAPAGPAATGPLDRLRAGEIDLDRYLDLKVDEATRHLAGLRAHEMEGLRSLLREQLASDPALVELVQQATGQRPTPKE
jgi:hypothetical protein